MNTEYILSHNIIDSATVKTVNRNRDKAKQNFFYHYYCMENQLDIQGTDTLTCSMKFQVRSSVHVRGGCNGGWWMILILKELHGNAENRTAFVPVRYIILTGFQPR